MVTGEAHLFRRARKDLKGAGFGERLYLSNLPDSNWIAASIATRSAGEREIQLLGSNCELTENVTLDVERKLSVEKPSSGGK